MRTIPAVVGELARVISTKGVESEKEEKYGELLMEILEISKANESVKGDLISRSLLKQNCKITGTFNDHFQGVDLATLDKLEFVL